ncbi:hypothetical protein F6B41_16930 [Microbacterium lushaniae]|nr:hypothetical protein F6B41_18275 [Microbacterium lushaniae]KAA9152712.1 hypothetical protein F6B41_16930 [Microbacterium lushaniae]
MPKPPSPPQVAGIALACTVVAGVLTYALLAIISRSLSAAEFDEFSVFWSLALIVGFGAFLPAEQLLAARHGTLSRRTAIAAWRTSWVLAGAAIVIACVAAVLPFPQNPVSVPVLVGLAAVAVVSPLQYVTRGLLLAFGRQVTFAVALVVDAALRVVLAAGIAVAAIGQPARAVLFMVAVALAIAIAHTAVYPRSAPFAPDPAEGESFARPMLTLLPQALSSQVLANAAPLIVFALGPVGAAGAFQASFTLARLPLFLITPVQAMLVPPFTVMLREGQTTRLLAAIRALVLGVTGLAAAGAVVGYLAGPWAVELIFGRGRALAPLDLAILVAGVVCMAGLIIFTQAVIAAGRHRLALLAWSGALGAAAVTVVVAGGFLPIELACSIALLLSSLAALLGSALTLRTHLTRG